MAWLSRRKTSHAVSPRSRCAPYPEAIHLYPVSHYQRIYHDHGVMRIGLILLGFIVVSWHACVSGISNALGGTRGQDTPYKLTVPVNEVSITFHVSDSRGSAIDNLTQRDLRLVDNEQPQNKFLSLESYQNLTIRAGFLFDTSGSMLDDLDHNASIANLYASHLLKRGADKAFVVGFNTEITVTQDWTDSPDAIALGIQSVAERRGGENTGTAIFDSLYKTCRDRWNTDRGAVTGNFILLFTDGIDNASHARIDDVIDMCQRTRTAIYIFTNQWNSRGASKGGRTLNELVTKSGGRLFLNPNDDQILKDVQTIDADQRNQYRLVYKPSNLIADGSFHRVKLRCSVRGAAILARSGYYAPGRS
jgi:Ca-activated chloride channel family protein